jgi:hypothetical protein
MANKSFLAGDFFVPHRGRALLGCERLLLQGIPFFRLLLGNETNVQLGDLSGNAMSLSVVCATILAAMTCSELQKITLKEKTKASDVLKRFASKKSVEWSPKCLPIAATSSKNPLELFKALAELSDEAIFSSVWCTCETSGSNSTSSQFIQCRVSS